MKQFVLVVAVAGTFFFSQVNSFACLIGRSDSRSVPYAFDNAKAVFIGEVTEIKKPVSSDPNAPLADRLYKVSFRVEYSWKGAGFQEFGAPGVFVLYEQKIVGIDDCLPEISFTEGRKYLVFADENERKELVLHPANRTAPLSVASEDVKELQKMSKPFYRFTINRVSP